MDKNNTFYNKIRGNAEEITWKDIFSDFRKKHTKQDFDRAMQRGTPAMHSPRNVLGNWDKPWLFYDMLKIGLLLYVLIYGMIYLLIQTRGGSGVIAINLFVIIIPPLILPVVLMTFFWELNIPANISFARIFIYFIAGGFLSLVATIFLRTYITIGNGASTYAPFTEEPAKLLIGILFLWVFSKEHPDWKIYGLTGLAIGAAVGAGFGGFESVQYGLKYGENSYLIDLFQYIDGDGLNFLIQQHVTRGVWAVAGHTLYCAPFVAAAALHMKKGKITKEMFLNQDFGQTFAVSFACHAAWNTFSSSDVIKIIITVILWMNTLYITRKCFAQVAGGRVMTTAHYIVGEAGYLMGKTIPLSGCMSVGRGDPAEIRFPGNYRGISRMHCRFEIRNQKIYVTDLGSTYGTYINGKFRLPDHRYVEVTSGTVIYLGSPQERIRIQ